jgi:hypothetical protein
MNLCFKQKFFGVVLQAHMEELGYEAPAHGARCRGRMAAGSVGLPPG